ncbi:MAG: phosphoribosylformylglycinamidine synthase subunit PurQ [Euryarchaeota archaeon]|nr:phosphoribosylformylglycinamidine synthase subunit PurQ [Euryarchaeota archaeon]
MRRKDVKVAILRMEGTNSEDETFAAFEDLGASPEFVHLNQLTSKRLRDEDMRRLADYHALFVPGGFSAGDYIRAGAIFAARMRSALGADIERFVADGKPIGGVCNGFQVLVELGLLPAIESHFAPVPEAVLHINDSAHYECRPVLLKHESRGTCAFTRGIKRGKVLKIISAHGEGKLLMPREKTARLLRSLADHDQIVFRYVDEDGRYAGYPWNPNGAPMNIAGLSNREGNVFGMMPHPERSFYKWMDPNWTRTGKAEGPGDGQAVFESVLRYAEKNL